MAIGNGVGAVAMCRVGDGTGVAVAEDLIMGEAGRLSVEVILMTGAELQATLNNITNNKSGKNFRNIFHLNISVDLILLSRSSSRSSLNLLLHNA